MGSNLRRIFVIVLTLFSFPLYQCATLDELDFWPLFTPMLGNISIECKTASEAYINHLVDAVTNPGLASTSAEHRNALRMFDSNGPIPFLQEGQLQDTVMVDLCRTLQLEDWMCSLVIPEDIRYVAFPYGHAKGPGLERVCRDLNRSKYCHNYLGIFDRETYKPALPKNLDDDLKLSSFEIKSQHSQSNQRNKNKNVYTYHVNLTRALSSWTKEHFPISLDIDTKALPKLSGILMKTHKSFEKLVMSVREIVARLDLFDDAKVDPYFVMGVWIYQWWGLNLFNPPVTPNSLPYQGICYPDACTKEDIETSNLAYAWKIYGYIEDSPLFAFSPLFTFGEDITYG